jgi:5-methylthioribose kinase
MKSVKSILPGDAVVTVPTIHHFDDVAHVVIMEDCGVEVVTLKQMMLENPPSLFVANTIGTGLGEFLGRLHAWGHDPQTSNHAFFDQNQQGKMLSGFITYGRLVSTLTGRDDIPALSDPLLDIAQSKLDTISKLSSEKIHAINTSHQTLTMGDFWTGNIMVCLNPTGDSLERVYVVDWEVAKPGLAGLDVGQLCAEMHLLRQFSPACHESATAAMDAFLKAYRDAVGVDLDVARDAAVHVGAHLVAWTPRVPWGGKELTREVVDQGVEYLTEGYAATQEWLRGSFVGPLL